MIASSAAASKARSTWLLWGGVAAAAITLSPLAPAIGRRLPPCVFKTLTSLPCPGCGSGRAMLALSRFDLAAAARWNPLAATLAIGFLVAGLIGALLALAGRPWPEPRIMPRGLRWGAFAAIALNWLWLLADGR